MLPADHVTSQSCSCFRMLCRLSVLMLLAASALAHLDLSLLDSQWNEWKLTHRREYDSQVSNGAEKVEEEPNL